MEIQSFERDASIESMTSTLNRDGVLIIREHVAPERMQGFRRTCDELFETQRSLRHEFFGGKDNRLMFGVFEKAPELTELLLDPVVGKLADVILLPACNAYQLQVCMFGQVRKGGAEQILHRADDIYEPHLMREPGQSRILSFMWAGANLTADNGATRIVPGSHHWPRGREAEDSEVTQAVMPSGSLAVWLGGTLHGLAISRVSKPRTSVFMSFSLGWLRSEENQYLAVPPEVAEKLPLRAQQLLGYQIFGSALGFVEGRDPECLLREGENAPVL